MTEPYALRASPDIQGRIEVFNPLTATWCLTATGTVNRSTLQMDFAQQITITHYEVTFPVITPIQQSWAQPAPVADPTPAPTPAPDPTPTPEATDGNQEVTPEVEPEADADPNEAV